MTRYHSTIQIPFVWYPYSDGKGLRSDVVGGYQAEIWERELRIVNSLGITIAQHQVHSKAYGRKKAEQIFTNLLSVKSSILY